jgi:hypothetical protein
MAFALEYAHRNTILAALRYYQELGKGEPANRSDSIHDIATDGGDDISLDSDGIDELCEEINSGLGPDDGCRNHVGERRSHRKVCERHGWSRRPVGAARSARRARYGHAARRARRHAW